jgi:hypothetical protein
MTTARVSLPILEFRRYTIVEGQRAAFATAFDTLFPEAFQQIGCPALGQFTERDNPNGFTWLRAFADVGARSIANAEFYFGPLWKEHRSRINARLVDSDHVLLLETAYPERGVAMFPAVDPVTGPVDAAGVIAAQIFLATDANRLLEEAEPWFQRYASDGLQELGVLKSLEGPNTFPYHPVRTDGPFVVWLGLAPDDRTVDRAFRAHAQEASHELVADGLVRAESELVLLDPTPRSRIRWRSKA